MPQIGYMILTLSLALVQGGALRGIEIINTGKPITVEIPTRYNAGPDFGEILNRHYFPGIILYNAGRYKEAHGEFTYFTDRPNYLEMNPRQAEYRSTAYYLRGMILFYHAEGMGRHRLAAADFMKAVELFPSNHRAHLELSKVYATLGFKEQAVTIVRNLLELNPEEQLAAEARKHLESLEKAAPGPVRKN